MKNVSFTDYASGIQLPDHSKLAVNWKNDNDVIIFWHDVIAKFFWRCFAFLAKFNYKSKFHVNINTGSGVMRIFFYKGLTRNREIRNTPVSNKMLLNAAKCKGYSFYRFWVIKGKPTGEGGQNYPQPPHPPTQIRVKLTKTYKDACMQYIYLSFLGALTTTTNFKKTILMSRNSSILK